MSKIEEQRKRYADVSDIDKKAKHIHDDIMKYMDNATSNGSACIEYILPEWGRKIPDYARLCIQQLLNEGYYIKSGWRETTPAGNERPFIVVSLEPFPPQIPIYKTYGFWVVVTLLTILIILIALFHNQNY